MILKFKDLNKFKKARTVYTAGSFDLFHCGHVAYLKQIKKKFPNYKLVVGVLSDKRIGSKKGGDRPIVKQKQRVAVVDAIKYVDYSFIVPSSKEDMTFSIIEKFRPTYVISPQRKYLKDNKKFNKFGSKIIIQSRHLNTSSTTKIIEKIKSL